MAPRTRFLTPPACSSDPRSSSRREAQERLKDPQNDDSQINFEPPEHGRRAPVVIVKAGAARREFALDLVNHVATFSHHRRGRLSGGGMQRFLETGAALSHDVIRTFSIAGDDPLSARSLVRQNYAPANCSSESKGRMMGSCPKHGFIGVPLNRREGRTFAVPARSRTTGCLARMGRAPVSTAAFDR
jgi:hypothetical protein